MAANYSRTLGLNLKPSLIAERGFNNGERSGDGRSLVGDVTLNETSGTGRPRSFGTGVAVLVLCLGCLVAHGQRVVEGKNLKFPEYFEPPHETQLKSLLEGARVQPQASGFYLITEAKLQTYREDGVPEMVVTAPQCLYDSGPHWISSAGPLRVQTAAGSFSIEGEGFLYRQTNSDLFISNRVHTIVHPELLPPKDPKKASQEPVAPAEGI